ncbi:penicillin-binding protein activator LpoB [Candidatus Laterigemmans baculatus]|uniref:penicillin-binding protein activator LpoB n=1 Tax=Candidatus Laterigemmans baculatus TaxID=2770505 RepID=UPI0013D9ADB3|nr:penicillin-binding protein activator LpoB [Candidatus Laterigemmans baculatus]
MDRRDFLSLCTLATASVASGCAGRQYGHLLSSQDVDMVGSHQAGAAVWNPLVDEAVAKLLGRCDTAAVQPVGFTPHNPGSPSPALEGPSGGHGELPPPAGAVGPAAVCFIGLENKSAEEMIDFKEQLYERIDSQVNGAANFRMISRRMVDAALLETRLRPDSLFVPANQALFSAALGRQGSTVDFLLYGKITSGTTERNDSTQRDYLLTLEMVNVHTGDYVKESATIRKGYHKSRAGKWWNYGPFQQADG